MKDAVKSRRTLVRVCLSSIALLAAFGAVRIVHDRQAPAPNSVPSSLNPPSISHDSVRIRQDSATEAPPSLLSEKAGRAKTLRLLSDIPNPTTAECLETLASSPREPERALAAQLLGHRAGEPEVAEQAVPALLTALEEDERPRVRLRAARALGLHGSAASEAIPALMDQLHHHTMGDIAVQALGRIGPDAGAAVEPIASLVRDERLMVGSRIMAIEALVKIGGLDHPQVADVLRFAADDPDPQIGLAARQAVKSAQPPQPTDETSPTSPLGLVE